MDEFVKKWSDALIATISCGFLFLLVIVALAAISVGLLASNDKCCGNNGEISHGIVYHYYGPF